MKYIKYVAIGIITGLLNGLFGAGGGSVVVPAMEIFLKTNEKKAHATAILIILMLSLVSSFIYLSKGFFNLNIWAMVTIGGVAGGAIGAKVLGKISQKWLKIIFGGVIILTATKMIF